MEKKIICFDIGGSSVKCAVCTKSGELYDKERISAAETLDGLVSGMQDYKERMSTHHELEGVAISSCGAVDCESGIIGGCSAIDYIHGPDWKKLMQEYLQLPCEIENDANCAALSELYFGKAKDISEMCFLVIGTGVGGAFVTNRRIYHGKHLYGGEFGMMLVRNEHGEIVNTSLVASTSSMARRMEEKTHESWDGLRVFQEAEHGKEDCIDAIETFYEEVAFCVFNLQHTFDPEMILFGGAISARADFCEKVMQAYDKLCGKLDLAVLTPKLMCCSYLQDANLLGALANYLQRRS